MRWLILDCNFLCHKAFHALKHLNLSHKDIPTGVIFGFMKELNSLSELHQCGNFVFCFDEGFNLRENVLPTYKEKRRDKVLELTEEEQKSKKEFYKQVTKLRDKYLPLAGFRNIFHQDGYEGDDIMASVAENLPKGDLATIVTSDQDLFQCITKRVDFYDPSKRQLLTKERFKFLYGICPSKWGMVKSIGGCSTDEVPGVKGVGEPTAIKYLKGNLPNHYKVFEAIESKKGSKIIARNKKIVVLPMKGTKKYKPKKEKVPPNWSAVAAKLGFQTTTKKSRKNRDGGFGL